ncbi:MAG: ParB/RepB/Spo0J family partition protein [Firmicutes bacterium]|nr:ParB/RepB/Spo0J family partition protein [Bacillota bacterium]
MTKQRLGRGLRALIPEGDQAVVRPAAQEIDVNEISPNPFQPRRTFDEEKLAQLADSIKQHGLLEPVIVRRKAGRYELVVGERRWRASQLAGLAALPAIVRDYSDRDMMQLALIENLQREDLNPVEEAEGFQRLIEEFGLTQAEVAEVAGRSRSSVANSLRLLGLDSQVRGMLERGQISTGHAKVLLGVENVGLRQRLAARVVREDLSVRQLERLVKLSPRVPRGTLKRIDPEIVRLEEELQRSLGTKVSIGYKRGRGKIEIEYYSDEELERIVELLRP